MIIEDTIVALATAPGDAGVAILRLSGPESIRILSLVFRTRRNPSAPDFPDRRLVLGMLYHPGDLETPVDECLAVVMRCPHSFTGEDVAEIHCHGGRAVVAAGLDALIAAGARPGEPGEFSRRAYLNGRMDLAQAEALGDLIGAQTQLARRLALRQLRGGLSDKITALQSRLIDSAAHLEAHLDFPDEDIPDLARHTILETMAEVRSECAVLLATFRRARLVREGARVVLAGKPNAGKSSIFNALLNRERAIVTPHAGTTRDTLEATVDLGGVPVTLIDTAGLREATDEVERIGIERSAEELRGADVVLHVVEASGYLENGPPEEEWLWGWVRGVETGREPVVVTVLNKCDQLSPDALSRLAEVDPRALQISALSRAGISTVEEELESRLTGGSAASDEIQIVRARHAEGLRAAMESLERAEEAFAHGISGEFVMVDLRDGILHLGEILGERLDEQILDRIFSTFCLGK